MAATPIEHDNPPSGGLAKLSLRRNFSWTFLGNVIFAAAQWGMLVASAVLSLLTYLGYMNPGLLLALTLAVGTGTALNSPAWQASVRAQVGPRERVP